MSIADKVVKCVILPQFNSNLLLPKATIAAVMEGKNLDIVVDLQGAMIGKVRWQGFVIPLLSFEAVMSDDIARFNAQTQVVILYSTGANQSLPYIAVTTQNDIKEVELDEGHVESIESSEGGDTFYFDKVKINKNLEAIIPDLSSLVEYAEQYAS